MLCKDDDRLLVYLTTLEWKTQWLLAIKRIIGSEIISSSHRLESRPSRLSLFHLKCAFAMTF